MIRFVDTSKAMIGGNFSFWDTVTDKYLEYQGNQAWHDFEDFKEDYEGTPEYLKRLERLYDASPSS